MFNNRWPGRYLEQRGRKCQQTIENYVTRSFMVCTFSPSIIDYWCLVLVYGIREMGTGFFLGGGGMVVEPEGKIPPTRYHLQDATYKIPPTRCHL